MKVLSKRERDRTAIDDVICTSTELIVMDIDMRGRGYELASGRVRHHRDGTATVRVVWRDRDAGLSVPFSARRVELP